jgi:hypothetical protein
MSWTHRKIKEASERASQRVNIRWSRVRAEQAKEVPLQTERQPAQFAAALGCASELRRVVARGITVSRELIKPREQQIAESFVPPSGYLLAWLETDSRTAHWRDSQP